MRLTRVHVDAPLQAGRDIELGAGASEHLVKVLRLAPGQALTLFDGRGGEYGGEIAAARRERVTVRVLEHRGTERESPLTVALLQSLARGEKMDWIVQKATELGATHITPVAAERSLVQLDARRTDTRLSHWRAIAVHACEQCGRNRLPQIAAPQTVAAVCANTTAGLRLMLDPDGATTLPAALAGASEIALLIGPEGGFSPQELAQARLCGFIAVRCGPRVLRTETAGVAALAAIQALVGDFRA